MKIHAESGLIEFAGGSIRPGIDRNAFLASPLGKLAEKFVDNEPYVTYRIRPERAVVATLSFNGSRLTALSWLLEFPDETERKWTEENELHRRAVHDRWLQQELGPPPYDYAWGGISSDYDPKGCVSDIIVTYAS